MSFWGTWSPRAQRKDQVVTTTSQILAASKESLVGKSCAGVKMMRSLKLRDVYRSVTNLGVFTEPFLSIASNFWNLGTFPLRIGRKDKCHFCEHTCRLPGLSPSD